MSDVVKKFGGYGGHMDKRGDKFVYVVSDFRPNTIAAGEGDTPEEAIANVTEAKYGYRLRFDFLDIDINTPRGKAIADWIWSLSHDQKNMLVEIMDADQKSWGS